MSCQRKFSMPARFKAFLRARVLAVASGFPAQVNTRSRSFPSCRCKTSSAVASNGTAIGLPFFDCSASTQACPTSKPTRDRSSPSAFDGRKPVANAKMTTSRRRSGNSPRSASACSTVIDRSRPELFLNRFVFGVLSIHSQSSRERRRMVRASQDVLRCSDRRVVALDLLSVMDARQDDRHRPRALRLGLMGAARITPRRRSAR